MLDTQNEELHTEHRQWLRSVSLWKDELESWRSELGRAGDELREAESALKNHAAALEQYAGQLQKEEHAIREHEQGISLVERGRVGWVAGEHVDDAWYPRIYDAHERLKKYHHTVMARVSLLLKAIAEPM